MEPPKRGDAEGGGRGGPERDDGENPFSSRFVRPGAISFVFPVGESIELLVTRLLENNWRGEVVGPHGSGKSTLLATLLPAIESRGFTVRRIDLHDGQRSLPCGWLVESLDLDKPFLVIDGYEQLGRWERWRVARAVKKRGAGLLVTAHEGAGLPQLFTSGVDDNCATEVLKRLVPEQDPLVTELDLAGALARHPGDLRSALFALYDLYEERRRGRLIAAPRD